MKADELLGQTMSLTEKEVRLVTINMFSYTKGKNLVNKLMQ